MKYISSFFMASASSFLVTLMSLSSCSPNPEATTTVMAHPSTTPLTSQAQAQPQGERQVATAMVTIRNFKFEPAQVTLAVGETVQFINTDEEPHTVTSTNGAFNSKALDTNQTWNYTATKAGTFPYICSIHPFMKGTLTVTKKN
jgi:plastocyanin